MNSIGFLCTTTFIIKRFLPSAYGLNLRDKFECRIKHGIPTEHSFKDCFSLFLYRKHYYTISIIIYNTELLVIHK